MDNFDKLVLESVVHEYLKKSLETCQVYFEFKTIENTKIDKYVNCMEVSPPITYTKRYYFEELGSGLTKLLPSIQHLLFLS